MVSGDLDASCVEHRGVDDVERWDAETDVVVVGFHRTFDYTAMSAAVRAVLASFPESLSAKARALTSGRYVRVEIPGNNKMLSLAEVQVFAGAENVAKSGEAKQSSTDYDGPAKYAIDGNTASLATLAASPGADGKISLREAITAANTDQRGTRAGMGVSLLTPTAISAPRIIPAMPY